MARKAKTVLGERNLQQSQVMERAGEQGIAAEQRATEGLTRQSNVGLEYGLKAGGQAAAQYTAGQAQQQREKESGLQEEIATGREIQTDKERKARLASQGLEEAPGGQDTPLMARYKQSLEGDVQRGEDAKKSLQPGGEPREPQATSDQYAGPAGPPQAGGIPQPARMDQVAQQAETPLETVRPGQVRPTEPGGVRESARGRQSRETGEELNAYKAITDRMKVTRNLASARASGNEAEIKIIKDQLKAQMKPKVDLLDRLMDNKPKPGDWDLVGKWAEKNPDPQLQQDIETGKTSHQMTSRVRDFINRKISAIALDQIEMTGDRPEIGMDPTSPAIQMFERNTQVVNQVMQGLSAASPQFGTMYAGINSQGSKIRFVQEIAAWFTKQMLADPGSQQQQQDPMMASQSPDPQQRAALESKGQGETVREQGASIAPADVMAPGSGAGIHGGSAGSPAKWSNVR